MISNNRSNVLATMKRAQLVRLLPPQPTTPDSMASTINISSDEPIVCPKDQHRFPLHQGITRQTIEKYEREFDKELEKRGQEFREQIEKDIKRKAAKEFALKQTELEEKLAEKDESLKKAQALAVKAQKEAKAKALEEFEPEKKALQDDKRKAEREFAARQTELEERLAEKDESLKRAQALAAKAQKEAKAKALAEFEPEKKALQDELGEKDMALKTLRGRELELLKEKAKLQQAKENLELENQRKLGEERQKIQDEVAKREAEKSRLKFAELEKKLTDAQRLNDDLTRKLDQSSQQLQGEVLELELEGKLRSAFPYDRIEPVRKGALGADILHRVHTPTGQACGTIIWEAKRAKIWSDKWLQKLKDDQREAGAEIAILVTTVFPKECSEPFMLHGDVWITSDIAVLAIAEAFRVRLIEISKLRVANTGRNEKAELLYNYLCSPQFAQRIRSVVETFAFMKRTLDQEKTAMARLWKQREAQINGVESNMAGMCGELQAISHGSLHQLEEIEQLALPTGDDDTANE